ncbi:hypothetical protein [uncultured Nostoc sp.]
MHPRRSFIKLSVGFGFKLHYSKQVFYPVDALLAMSTTGYAYAHGKANG